jgi:hypothetical protein
MLNQPINLRSILRYLAENHGMQQLAAAVDEAFSAWFDETVPRSWTFERYVRHHGAKDLLGKIRATKNAKEDPQPTVSIEDIAEFIRLVRLPPEVLLGAIDNRPPFPFDRFVPGSSVRVCVAKRMAQNAEGLSVDAKWLRASHGSRDVLAVADAVDVLGRNRHLDFRLSLVAVPPASWPTGNLLDRMDRAAQMLHDLIEDKLTGAVVSIGSGPHNLVSNEIAKRVFDDCKGNLPVQFRWTTEGRGQIDYLNEGDTLRSRGPKGIPGIWYLKGNGAYFLRRDADATVMRLCEGERNRRRRFFYDCGLLAIDVRGRIPLILAAGHGGNATRACIKALGDVPLILEGVRRSSLPGRFVSCLVVARRKPTDEAVDDLELVEKRRSWYHFDLEDVPDGLSFPAVECFAIPR